MHAQLGQIMDNKTQKDQKNPTATSEEPGAKAGYCTCPLLTAQLKGWVNHLSYPSGLTPGPTLTLTPYEEPACLCQGTSKETRYFFPLPSPAAGTPIKPCLNFSSSFLSISVD